MKKSTLFLTLALTTPVVISLIGFAAGAQQGKTEAAPDRAPDHDGPRTVVFDEPVAIDESLRLKVDAGKLAVTFDPTLTGQARVKIEATRKEDVEASMSKSELSFHPTRDADSDIRISIALPTKLASLRLELNAGKCEVASKDAITVKQLTVELNAGKCDLELARLSGDELNVAVNSGSLEFETTHLDYRKVTAAVNAGKLDWEATDVSFPESGKDGVLHFTTAAGGSEVELHGMPEHALTASASMGNLELKRLGQSVQLKGMNEERVFTAAAGAPRVLLEASMGNMKVEID